HIKKNQFPTEIEFALKENDSQEKYSVEYNLDPRLQKEADGLFKRYKPDYGAVVLMEATTGKILALSSFQKDDQKAPNLALRASYPAASL
ncbi:MAG: penicillin-binding protein, partial [Bdellovibrionaceae bacterium]|nr:penicillin-binding protein [Pseudobdellovibrionaceae bacterium]